VRVPHLLLLLVLRLRPLRLHTLHTQARNTSARYTNSLNEAGSAGSAEHAENVERTKNADLLRLGGLERPLQLADALALRRRLHPRSVQLDLSGCKSPKAPNQD
jgi:hypothetical protein